MGRRKEHTMGTEEELMLCKNVLEIAGRTYGYKSVTRKAKRSSWWNDELRETMKRRNCTEYFCRLLMGKMDSYENTKVK